MKYAINVGVSVWLGSVDEARSRRWLWIQKFRRSCAWIISVPASPLKPCQLVIRGAEWLELTPCFGSLINSQLTFDPMRRERCPCLSWIVSISFLVLNVIEFLFSCLVPKSLSDLCDASLLQRILLQKHEVRWGMVAVSPWQHRVYTKLVIHLSA